MVSSTDEIIRILPRLRRLCSSLVKQLCRNTECEEDMLREIVVDAKGAREEVQTIPCWQFAVRLAVASSESRTLHYLIHGCAGTYSSRGDFEPFTISSKTEKDDNHGAVTRTSGDGTGTGYVYFIPRGRVDVADWLRHHVGREILAECGGLAPPLL